MAVILGPGPQTLIAGTMLAGFFGEVPVTELIDGEEARVLSSKNKGTAFNTNEPWLKFAYLGSIYYVAKKPYRYNLKREDFFASGVGQNNNKVVTVKGIPMYMGLMVGNTAPTTTMSGGLDLEITHGSLWNRLIYRISASPNKGNMSSEGITTGDWAQYSDEDLGLTNVNGHGVYTFCANDYNDVKDGQGVSRRISILRGGNGASNLGVVLETLTDPSLGWRPVLRIAGEFDLGEFMHFTDIEGNQHTSEADIDFSNNIILDFEFDASTLGLGVNGNLFLNDVKVGSFTSTPAGGTVTEWYAGSKLPIFVKNGDVFKAVALGEIAGTKALTVRRLQPDLTNIKSLSKIINKLKPIVPTVRNSEVIVEVIKRINRELL